MQQIKVLGHSVRNVVRRLPSNNRDETWGVEYQLLLDNGEEPELVRCTHWAGSNPLPHAGEPRVNRAGTYEYYDAGDIEVEVPDAVVRAKRSDGTKLLLDAQTLTPWAIELVPQQAQQSEKPRYDM